VETGLFKRFCEIAYDRAGIHLKTGKEPLVAARVAKRVRRLGLNSAAEYLDYLEADETGDELVQYLDTIVTNFTNFFRERQHFDVALEHFKVGIDKGQRRWRFWSCASSTGEEPYSLAMTLYPAAAHKNLDLKILATDISVQALKRAAAGAYREKDIESLSREELRRFFVKQRDAGNGEVQFLVRPELKSWVVYRRLNLSLPPWPMRGPLDVVFCRNVMIYFDNRVRSQLVSSICGLLKPGGYLFTGQSESLASLQHGLKMIRPSIYQKPGDASVGQ
jgi:chemotaxis protein methyltransferase CheR